jgi:hypothetical protein
MFLMLFYKAFFCIVFTLYPVKFTFANLCDSLPLGDFYKALFEGPLEVEAYMGQVCFCMVFFFYVAFSL